LISVKAILNGYLRNTKILLNKKKKQPDAAVTSLPTEISILSSKQNVAFWI